MTSVSYTPNERQLTLLEFIIVSGPVSRELIVRSLPAYREGSPMAILRKIERDLMYLRRSGYPIATDSENRYFYDRSAPLLASVSALDVGLLRSLIAGIRTRGPLVNAASSGMSKLLAASPAQQTGQKYLQANIPQGDSALFLARAMQNRKRVQFNYGSSGRSYLLEPAALEEHFDVYFVSGQARGTEWSWRTFRATRIIEDSLMVVGPAELDAAAPESDSFFSYSDVVIAIRPGHAAPLASRGILKNDDEYYFRELSRNRLFEALATYGADVRLLGPEPAVKDWQARLAHLGGIHG